MGVNGQENRDDGGLEAHDAPKTPPEEFDPNEAVVSNVTNNENLIANQNNLAQHVEIVENRPLDTPNTHSHGPGNNEGVEEPNQARNEVPESQPVFQNQEIPEPQAPTWPEPSNQELPSRNQSESRAIEEVAQTESSSEQPAYDLLGDLGAVV